MINNCLWRTKKRRWSSRTEVEWLQFFFTILHWSMVDEQCFRCQQSDSVILTHVSILFQVIFPLRLLHNIKLTSLCITVGPCWLSILNTAVCSSLPNSHPHPHSLLVTVCSSFLTLKSSPSLKIMNLLCTTAVEVSLSPTSLYNYLVVLTILKLLHSSKSFRND